MENQGIQALPPLPQLVRPPPQLPLPHLPQPTPLPPPPVAVDRWDPPVHLLSPLAKLLRQMLQVPEQ